MAEPITPDEGTAEGGRRAAVPEQTASVAPAADTAPAETGAAIRSDAIARDRPETGATEAYPAPPESTTAYPAPPETTAYPAPPETTAYPAPPETTAYPAPPEATAYPAPPANTTAYPAPPETTAYPAPVAPPEQQPIVPPASVLQSAPPSKQGNRLVGTLWVLLAAGIYQVVFFGSNALVALAFGGTSAVVPQVQSIAQTSLAWLPVLLFFLLFELVVLLTNRAGRVVYVFASLIVGALVYVLTVVLFSLLVRHSLGDANTLAQTFLNWEFILIGLVAREVMLWTGLAIGSRGIRVRTRNREARRRYDAERLNARA